ncbi:hypothetical protein [Paraburkholderia sacchari]|uniref:hypothetical protein n=1 Tax=Paraburkholderia sacchari TaxID=159450 RepID=UPI003D994A2F
MDNRQHTPVMNAASCDLLDAAQAAEAVLARGRWIEGSMDPEAVALWKLRAAIAKAKAADAADRQHDAGRDDAVILLDRLRALAALLAAEEAATAFAGLDTPEQVAIFGLLEQTAGAARAALTRDAEVRHA